MRSRMQRPVVRWLGVGMLAMAMLAGCGGGGSDSAAPPVAVVPQPAILFAGAVSAAAEGADAIGSMGGQIELDAGGSKDADGGALSFAWSIVGKPPGSKLALGAANVGKLSFQADAMGSYVFKLRVSNSKGGFAEKNATVLVNNTVPNAVTVVRASFAAEALIKPAVAVSIGSGIVLDASKSSDPDGDTVTTTWELIGKPAASTAALVPGEASSRFVVDVAGTYQVRARGTDPMGAYAEAVYVFEAANRSPYNNVILDTVAVIDRAQQTSIAGALVAASGALSYDEAGAALRYQWALESRPAASVAAIAAPALSQLTFTPDVAGAYVLSLTVNNGRVSNTAYLKLNVLASVPAVTALNFKPEHARYSRSMDRLVVVAGHPDALKIIHPLTGVTKSVILPAAGKSMNLSANGKLAAVLHEGSVSLVDLEAAQIVRTMPTGGAHTEVVLRDDGIAYFFGQAGGQWVRPGVVSLNLFTGAALTQIDYANGQFYGNMRGVFVASKNKALVISDGLSPTDISYFTVDPVSGALLGSGDSPYHGDYAMSGPLLLSSSEQLVFTAEGTYFDTDTLRYVGNLGLAGKLQSISQLDTRGEALVMLKIYQNNTYPFPVSYQSSYQRLSVAGQLLSADADIGLPTIGGQPSYGISIFHSSNGSHVALVQTGSALVTAPGLQYYLVYR